MFAKSREMMRRVRAFGLPAVVAVAGLLAFGAITGATAQTSQEKYRAMRNARSPFNLAASATVVLQANLEQCGLDNSGNVCTNIFNSPTGGGGYWPAGTTNQYIFNSGVQIAGINAANAGPWANDTTGAYFFDARGTQPQGDPLTQIYNSLDANDLANWPAGAVVSDTAIYNAALIGSKTISDQDTWVQYWDGNPNRIASKKHPMGIKVEQRSLAFNAPAGAENMLFFIYKLTNVTNDPAFQSASNAKFGITLPAAGFTIDSVYADFAMDPDVSANNATQNFSNVILPFNLGFAYEETFEASDFNFNARASLYAAPFLVGPGFIGVKYLRSPINPVTKQQVGLTLFTNFTNGGAFPDPTGVKQLWRFMSGRINGALGDPACNIPNPIQSRLCYLAQDPADTRFLQASGPFSLKAGESATIVVAYVSAAAVAANGYKPGTQVRPGIASTHPGAGGDSIRQIEKMAGWVSTPAAAVRGDGTVDESKVKVVTHSLLDNARIAQAIFNNKFLLPRPPEPPPFTLVPGNNQVTIVWTPSATETTGDPYFKIASDTTSALYNPNYINKDVVGYRILRSQGVSGSYEVIASFDKKGVTMLDYTGEYDATYVPETMGDYATYANATYGVYPVPVTATNGVFVEFPSGARIQDQATGAVIITKADTLALRGNGIPFAFVDNAVKNGITYRYNVQAFDLNSLASGAVSLNSPAQPQSVVPRANAANVALGAYEIKIAGSDGVALDPTAAPPTIDPEKGTFSGPMPPTDGFAVSLGAFVPEMLAGETTASVKIDSVHAGAPEAGVPGTYYLTAGTDKVAIPLTIGFTGTVTNVNRAEASFTAAKASADFVAKYKLQNAVLPGLVQLGAPDAYFTGVRMRGWVNGEEGGVPYSGPDVFVSGSAPSADPNIGLGTWWAFANGEAPADEFAKFPGPTAGEIPNYDIYLLKAYGTQTSRMRSLEGITSTVYRAADIELTWGANGAVTSVKDLTHHVDVPFGKGISASWGFLTPASFAGVTESGTRDKNNNLITASDWYCVEPVLTYGKEGDMGFADCSSAQPAVLQNTAVLSAVDTTYAGKGQSNAAGTGATARQGFGVYMAGELYFIFGALPASGTKWTFRTYTGYVDATPVTDAAGKIVDARNYSFHGAIRPPNVPGLQAVISAKGNTLAASVAEADLANVHTVPDPYYVRSQFDLGPGTKQMRFVNLPTQAVIRIYSVDGVLVRLLEHNDAIGGGEEPWDLRNRNNQFVSSGVYFYVIEAVGGKKKVGRFTVIQFAR